MRKGMNVKTIFIMLSGLILSSFLFTSYASAAIVDNEVFTLGGSVPAPWSSSGTGVVNVDTVESDLRIVTSAYDITGEKNFLIEAVVSSGPGGGGEAGARIWVRSRFDALAAPLFREVVIRFMKEPASADNFVGIYDHNDNLIQTPGGADAKLVVRWDMTVPQRIRVRLMRVGNMITLGAEASNVFDDDVTSQSVSVDLNDTNFPVQGGIVTNVSEFGFGNDATSGINQDSTWEYIHITTSDSLTEPMPYWPPVPPAPILTLNTMTMPHEVSSQVDLPVGAYLANDTATLVLDTLSGELSSAPIPDPSAPPAQHIETFTGLDSNQTVTGWVEIADVSGRTTPGPLAQLVIPDHGVENVQCFGFEPPLDQGPITIKGKNRALPLKAHLFDADGFPVTDADIIAPPVVEVLFDAGTGETPVDVEDDVLPAGQGTEGVQFVYTDGEKWQFNLKTKNHSASGTYMIKMISGDNAEYVIDPTCEVSFVVP